MKTLLATLMAVLPIPVHNKILDWCKNNHMNAYPGKCHVILSSNTQREIHFDNISIASSLRKKLLGITLDSELKFEELAVTSLNLINY